MAIRTNANGCKHRITHSHTIDSGGKETCDIDQTIVDRDQQIEIETLPMMIPTDRVEQISVFRERGKDGFWIAHIFPPDSPDKKWQDAIFQRLKPTSSHGE